MSTSTSQGADLPDSIAQIILNLSRRPNVESTLLLSRNDGNIIYAGGALLEDRSSRARALSSYSSNPPQPSIQPDETDGGKINGDGHVQDSQTASPELTHAQTLASSVMNFVSVGESLGADLTPHQAEDGVLKPEARNGNGQEYERVGSGQDRDEIRRTAEQDIQLLRLRTRNREIIIYPDTKYLCCVVQLLPKAGT